MSDPRYPIGKFSYTGPLTAEQKQQCLTDIEQTPTRLRAALRGLSEQQLDTPYRDGGWTVRQVVHHVADSHAMSLTRFKLALTEDWPTIKPYNEAAWAELADSKSLPIDDSIAMIQALHGRWVALLESMTEGDFKKGYVHPENGRQDLAKALAIYEWHSRHHVAHITALRARQGW